MTILLAIGAAVGWGAADFLGGASRRDTPVLVIVCVSELIGLVALIPVLILRGIPFPSDPRMLLAVAAGTAVTLELGLIYVALSRGDAFITVPVGALGAAAAVTVGLVGGDPLNATIAIGLLCALLGAATSALSTDPATGARTAIRSAAICVGAAGGVATLSAGVIVLASTRGHLRGRLPKRAQIPGLVQVALAGALGIAIQRRRANRVQAAAFVVALAGAALLGA